MKSNIIGRRSEQETLEKLYKSKMPEFVVFFVRKILNASQKSSKLYFFVFVFVINKKFL